MRDSANRRSTIKQRYLFGFRLLCSSLLLFSLLIYAVASQIGTTNGFFASSTQTTTVFQACPVFPAAIKTKLDALHLHLKNASAYHNELQTLNVTASTYEQVRELKAPPDLFIEPPPSLPDSLNPKYPTVTDDVYLMKESAQTSFPSILILNPSKTPASHDVISSVYGTQPSEPLIPSAEITPPVQVPQEVPPSFSSARLIELIEEAHTQLKLLEALSLQRSELYNQLLKEVGTTAQLFQQTTDVLQHLPINCAVIKEQPILLHILVTLEQSQGLFHSEWLHSLQEWMKYLQQIYDLQSKQNHPLHFTNQLDSQESATVPPQLPSSVASPPITSEVSSQFQQEQASLNNYIHMWMTHLSSLESITVDSL